jgi:hypothetical protein
LRFSLLRGVIHGPDSGPCRVIRWCTLVCVSNRDAWVVLISGRPSFVALIRDRVTWFGDAHCSVSLVRAHGSRSSGRPLWVVRVGFCPRVVGGGGLLSLLDVIRSSDARLCHVVQEYACSVSLVCVCVSCTFPVAHSGSANSGSAPQSVSGVGGVAAPRWCHS